MLDPKAVYIDGALAVPPLSSRPWNQAAFM